MSCLRAAAACARPSPPGAVWLRSSHHHNSHHHQPYKPREQFYSTQAKPPLSWSLLTQQVFGRHRLSPNSRRWMTTQAKPDKPVPPSPATPAAASVADKARRMAGQALDDFNTLSKRFIFLPRPSYILQKLKPITPENFVAIFSWLVAGNAVFLVVGTTTFVSLVLVAANTITGQGFFAYQVSRYLTKQLGMEITFQQAIVPNWKENRIRFENVKVSRTSATGLTPEQIKSHTQFDLTVEMLEVKISLMQLWEGKGLVRECYARGVRGTIDRRALEWDENTPLSLRQAQWGDFQVEKVQVEDLLVQVQNKNFRVFDISMINFEADRMRQQWLLYDILTARNITGTFDNALFSLHANQQADPTNKANQKMIKCKIVGVPFDHINNNTSGPISWIKAGNVDLTVYLDIPLNDTPSPVQHGVADHIFMPFTYLVKVGERVVDYVRSVLSGHEITSTSSSSSSSSHQVKDNGLQNEKVNFEVQMRLRNLRASVPLQEGDWGYVDTTLIRPLVAFVNSHSTAINTQCTVSLNLNNFNGSWDIWSCGLVDALSQSIYNSLLSQMRDEQMRSRRLKRVGLWSVRSISKSIISILEHLNGMHYDPNFYL